MRSAILSGASGRLGSALIPAMLPRYEIAAVYNTRELQADSQLSFRIDPHDLDSLPESNRLPVYALSADLRDPSSYRRIVELSLARFGKVDLLVHAAGAGVWDHLLYSNLAERSLEEQFQLHAFAPLRLSLEMMLQSWRATPEENRLRNRHILAISSMAGAKLFPNRGQSIYAASKAALNMLVVHMADEFSMCGVRVNALLPNSFPSLVTVEAVVQAILEIDRSDVSGQLVQLED